LAEHFSYYIKERFDRFSLNYRTYFEGWLRGDLTIMELEMVPNTLLVNYEDGEFD